MVSPDTKTLLFSGKNGPKYVSGGIGEAVRIIYC